MRQHGKRGAILREANDLRFEDYVTDHRALPAAPLDIDHVTGVKSFYMLGNGPDPDAPPEIAADGIGNCTVAALAEFYNVTSAFSGIYPGGVHFPVENVVKSYSDITGYVLGDNSTDHGAELTQVAEWAVKNCLVDDQGREHQLAGWCQIGNPSSPWLLRRVINLFGAVYMGYCLPDDAMNAFDNSRPFTDTSQKADPSDGHCMLYSYSDLKTWTENPGDASGKVITWGDAEGVSPAWNSKYVYQAFVLVTQDYIRKNGTTVQGLGLAQMLAESQDAA